MELHAKGDGWVSRIEVDFHLSSEEFSSYLGAGESIFLVPILWEYGCVEGQDISGDRVCLALKCIDKETRTFERFGLLSGQGLGPISAIEEDIIIV